MRVLLTLVSMACGAQADVEQCAEGDGAVFVQGKLHQVKHQDAEAAQIAIASVDSSDSAQGKIHEIRHDSESQVTVALQASEGTVPKVSNRTAVRDSSVAPQKIEHVAASSIETSLLARAGEQHSQTVHVEKSVQSKSNGDDCNMERTMGQKGQQKFNQAQKSKTSDKWHQKASELEFAVLDEVNRKRREGFTCVGSGSNEPTVKFSPKCRNEDLIFDCQLWFAAKQHSEDMGIRNYYAHDTLGPPFPSGSQSSREAFDARTKQYAWHKPAHKEVLMGTWGDQDTPQVVVQAWLKSYGHCVALGTDNAQTMGIGRADCALASGKCTVDNIGHFYSGLLAQRSTPNDVNSWGHAFQWFEAGRDEKDLDVSCYPATRDRRKR